MVKNKFYITTAIDYVNAKPHIGHAFEKVLADALARWHRLKKEDVLYLTGTDENAQKNAQVANEKGIDVQKFVDANSNLFIELCDKLDISYDDFIKTSEKRHVKKAQEIFRLVYDRGDIYKGKYEGLYCQGCEAFLTEKDLVDGKCPEHNKEPKKISEDSYFFKLSKYKDKLLKYIESYVVPSSKKNEIVSRLKEEGLRDLCVARSNLDWGIDCPIDKKFKIYVWFDALVNYLTGSKKGEKDYWPADVHVIGKGINWFHSVIWPAILMSAGIKLPRKLLVHGYLTLDGGKISKSLGNVIDPVELIRDYGSEAVRYSLLRCSVFEDSDYSEKILVDRYNNELANKYGNLILRVSALAEKNGIEKCKLSITPVKLIRKVDKYFESFEIDKALNEIFLFIDKLNEFIQDQKPWETGDKKVLYELLYNLRAVSILLFPFIPSSIEKIAKHFHWKIDLDGIGKQLKGSIKKSNVFFEKIEVSEKLKNGKLNKSENIKEIMEGVASVDFEDFDKLDLRVAEIEDVSDIEGADKLYKLSLDVGELGKRVICAGIKKFYSKDNLEGKKIVIIANLKPRMLRGIESKGMLLAASNKDRTKVVLLTPDSDIDAGSVVG